MAGPTRRNAEPAPRRVTGGEALRPSSGDDADRQDRDRKFRALWGALRRRWFVSLLLGLTFGLGGAALAYHFIPARFSTYSELRISSVRGQTGFATEDEYTQFENWKRTQLQLLKSPPVLSAVISKPEIAQLNLIRSQAQPVEWLERNLLVSNDGTELVQISLSGDEPDELAKLLNSITDSYLTDVVHGEQRQREARLESVLKIRRETEESLLIKQNAMKKLTETLEVGNTEQANQKQRYLLELAIQMRKELADINAQLLTAKLAQVTEPRRDAGTRKDTETKKDVANTRKDAEVKIENSEPAGDAQIEKDPDYQKAVAEVARLKKHVAQSEKQLGRNHPTLVAAQGQLAASEKRRDTLRTELLAKTKKHPTDQAPAPPASPPPVSVPPAISAPANTTFASVAPPAQTDSQSGRRTALLEARQKQLEKELDAVKLSQSQSGLLSHDFEELSRQIAQSQRISDQISSETRRMEVELQPPVNITLHRPAEVPRVPDQQQKFAGTAAAGIGLFMLFAGGIVWLDLRSKRISFVGEVSDTLKLPVLGTIPILPRFVTKRKQPRRSGRTVYWQNLLTESVDALRTVMLQRSEADRINCVMIASAMPGEGKTTLVCHLSTSLARAGRSVVVVDCDFRRPSIQQVLGVTRNSGLSEVLRGEIELSEAIQASAIPRVSVLTAGRFCLTARQSLARNGMRPVLAQLRSQFDFVIVDSSPVLAVADALLVAQHVDGVVFAIRRDVSRVASVAAASQRLSMLEISCFGAIAIGLDETDHRSRYQYVTSQMPISK